jgi:hypothetical protein
MVISHCLTQQNIKTNSMEHSAAWEVQRRSALQSSVSITEPEVSLQCSHQHKARWIHSHVPISIQPLHQRLDLVSGYFRISDQYFPHISLSLPPPKVGYIFNAKIKKCRVSINIETTYVQRKKVYIHAMKEG